MSSMLEQAIIDAEALKEAAIKNAESVLIEKYSEEDQRFWSPPKLLEDLVKQNKNFDSLN